MPPLANPRQELFCQNLVKGKSKAEAYRDAGYADDRHHASRLATNGNVMERYAELFDATTPEVKWDRETALRQYTELLMQAKATKNIALAIKAMDSISRVNGLIITRHESGKVGEFEGLTDYELLELIAEPLGDSRSDDSE